MAGILFHNANVFTGKRFIKNGAVLVEDGKISGVYEKDYPTINKNINIKGKIIAPGFIDTHFHGIGGYSFQVQSEKDVLNISKILPQFGVTSFVATISRMTNNKDEIIGDIKAVVEAKGKEQGAQILGIHLEGPFLSKGKRGGQIEDGIIPIDLEFMDELWSVSQGLIVSMTVAPELENIEKLVKYCQKKGIVLQAGHTCASYEQMRNAFNLGITHITHAYNAMTSFHHRCPGVVGAVLENDDVSCEIIADGCHVHSAAVKILMKCKSAEKIVLITDAQKFCKTNRKTYTECGIKYELDKCWCRQSDKTIIGSNISLLDGVRNFLSWGADLKNTLMAASKNPAKILNLKNKGEIKKGFDADFVVLDETCNLLRTYIKGNLYK